MIGNAVHIAKIATGEQEETTLQQPAKRNSGLAGAKARQESTTPEQREEIARRAANARWE
ncbi:histone H1 [uncultured Jannaschia sp.]|uniref:histone H1 n=1 Tax=uncultured Jannaschia sp. TaxID=293347 RepID=UPI00261733F3|nr:histone H1 [uncultured Jannaschia sp.]